MHLFKAIIVDDERGPRENLHLLINKYCPEISVTDVADSAMEAKRKIKELKPDVVFLDINMPVINGFELLESLTERNFMLVIVSAYEEFGIKAIKARAVDYLLKPVNISELQQTVNRLIAIRQANEYTNGNNNNNKLIIPQANGFTVLNTYDIVRFEADNCYTRIFLADNKMIVVSKTLKDFEEAVSEKEFFRIHKSHLINLKYFKEFSYIDGGYAILTNGSKLEVSRRKQKEFILKAKQIISQ